MLSKVKMLSFSLFLNVLTSTAMFFIILLGGLYFVTLELHARTGTGLANTIESEIIAQPTLVTLSQPNFRIRSDDSSLLNADTGWAAGLNSAATIEAERPFRLRFEIEETTGGSFRGGFKLQWRKGATLWADVQAFDPPTANATEAVGIVVSEQYTDGEATTNLLSGSSASFVGGTGEEDNTTGKLSLSNQHTELEWSVVIHTFYDGPAQNNDGDTFEFRVVEADGTPFVGTYNNPTITLNVPAGLIGGTYVESPNRIGPFKDTNGNLYAIIEPSETDNVFLVIKSTDSGDTWREMDGANRPAEDDLESVDVVQAGDTLHMVHHEGNDVFYHAFRMSDHPTNPDTWETTDDAIITTITYNEQAAAIERRSDGDLVVFYAKVSGSNQALFYKINTGGGWGTEQTLEAETGFEWHGVSTVMGASDKIHIFYKGDDGVTGPLYHRSLSSTDTLSGRETIDSDTDTGSDNRWPFCPPVYWDNSGNEKIMLVYMDTDLNLYSVVVTNDGTPEARKSASDNTTAANPTGTGSRQPVCNIALDGSDVYLHYADATSFDIFRDKSSNDGGWGTDTEEIDGVTGHWIRGTVFTHSAGNGGARVVGYIWDNGSAGGTGFIRYSEHQTVNAVNDPPGANDDAYVTDEDTTLNVAAPGVLGNDSDTENDPLTAVLDTSPSNGSLTLNSDGSFTYDPDPDFAGTDSFTYRANDGQTDSNIATVSLTVNPVNDAPVVVDDAYTIDEDTTLNVAAPGVLANDTDVEGDPLTAVLDAGPANGTLTFNSDGSFTYDPDPDFAGTDSFTYRANDGQTDSNLAMVSISVIGAPISVADIQPNTMQAGATIDVTITGSSFAAGANVTFENGNGPAPEASNIVVAADGKSLTANITAKSGGPPRPRVWDVRVTNPDGSSAVLAAGFTVTP